MPRPRKIDLEATQELAPPPVRGPRPWTGKVHDPGKIFEQEMSERKVARNSEFQAGQSKNILRRMSELEVAQERTDQKLDKILEALKPKAE